METTNYTDKKNSKKTEDGPQINVLDLLDNARKFVKENNYSQAESFINLTLLSPEIDFSSKIQAQAIKSYISYQQKKPQIVLKVAKKFSELTKTTKNIDQEISYCFLRAIYRSANSLSSIKQYFLSVYFWHRAKIFIDNNINLENDTNSKNTIEENFISTLNEISKKLTMEKEKYIQRPEIYRDLKETFSRELDLSDHSQRVFIVSSTWLKNMQKFLNKENTYVDKLFDRKNVLLLYLNDSSSDKDEYKRYLGNYPGPVNNFFIIDYKDLWEDPDDDESYTNTLLREDLKENNDYMLIPENVWVKLKSVFGCYQEIERHYITNDLVVSVETYLRRIKVLVLSDIILENNKELIRPRYIQMSKNQTLKNLKSKIVRSVFNSDNTSNVKSLEIKIFVPDMLGQKKKQLFEIVYSYINKFANYKIKGEELNLDEKRIEVKYF